MRKDKIVHFVSFETSLDSSHFISKWENFVRSVNTDADVTLQESTHHDQVKYIAQHRCGEDGFNFIFTKGSKHNRLKEAELKVKQAGGYYLVQEEQPGDATRTESKVFVFLTDPAIDLTPYRSIQQRNKLNIYSAYYENCAYSYILEFFVKDKDAASLTQTLEQYHTPGVGRYKECALTLV